MQIHFTAPQRVRDVIATLGRTEDVKFSPSNQRLAVAEFTKNRIAVFDVSISASPNGTNISLTGVAEISSTYLNGPHGLDFFDDDTIVVANRSGDATILRLPPSEGGGNCYEVEPIEVIRSPLLSSPGSVSVTKKDDKLYEVFICNNYANCVTSHLLDLRKGCTVKSNAVVLKKWLSIPDGICVSNGKEWLAVSNHNTHNVYLYDNIKLLNELSDPIGLLRGVYYPHGLRFSPACDYILVADAGAPYVHLYVKDASHWNGVRYPLVSLKVLSDEDFLRGRRNPLEGGPKGIDVDSAMNIFVTTCEFQPLAFFEFGTILEGQYLKTAHLSANSISREKRDTNMPHEHSESQRALEIEYELEMQNKLDQAKARAEADIAFLKNSRSWRITSPLRSMSLALRNLRGR